jgi:hypothetical protein
MTVQVSVNDREWLARLCPQLIRQATCHLGSRDTLRFLGRRGTGPRRHRQQV